MPDAHILSPESAVPTARLRPPAIELYLKYLRFRRYYLPQIRVILSVVLLFPQRRREASASPARLRVSHRVEQHVHGRGRPLLALDHHVEVRSVELDHVKITEVSRFGYVPGPDGGEPGDRRPPEVLPRGVVVLLRRPLVGKVLTRMVLFLVADFEKQRRPVRLYADGVSIVLVPLGQRHFARHREGNDA